MAYNNKLALLSETGYLILLCLIQHDSHGYEIHKQVSQMIDMRKENIQLRLSTVYHILNKLVEANYVCKLETKETLGIELYHISEEGIAFFKEETKFRKHFILLGEDSVNQLSATDGHIEKCE